MLVLIWD